MFESIKKIFESKPEKRDFELSREEIPGFLENKYSEKLENLGEEAEEKIESLIESINSMKSSVRDFGEIESFEDHQMIQDVKKSFSRQKLNLLDIEKPEKDAISLRNFSSKLDSRLEEFSEMTPKQEFVLKKHSEERQSMIGSLNRTKDLKEDLDRFIEDKLNLKEGLNLLESLNGEIESNKKEIQGKKEELSDLESEIEEKQTKLEELKGKERKINESDEAGEFSNLQEEIESMENKREEILRKGRKKVSRIERVLKKFRHLVESGERSLSKEKKDNLESLLNGKFLDIDTEELFVQIWSSIELNEIDLKSKKMKKFRRIFENKEIQELKEKYREIKERLEEKKNRLGKFKEFQKNKRDIENKIKGKERDIEALEERSEEKKEGIKELESQIDEKEKEIYEKANEITDLLKIKPDN